jgi:hypothetical protein
MEIDKWTDDPSKWHLWKQFCKVVLSVGSIPVKTAFYIYPRLPAILSWHLDATSNLFREFIRDIVLVN